MSSTSPKYGFEYWLGELIRCGRIIEPALYTDTYVEVIRRAWSAQGLTRLHQKVIERRAQALALKTNY
jgi:hypothetical protein